VPFLQFISSDKRSSRYELSGDSILIGRLSGCDINIGRGRNDVSRKHARLHCLGDKWYVEDLNSRNHTFVNNEDIHGCAPRYLRHSDRILICSYEFFFYESETPTHDSSSVRVQDSRPGSEPKSSVSLSATTAVDDSERLLVLLDVTCSLSNVLSLDEVLADTLASLLRIFPSARRGVIGFLEGDEFIPKWWKFRQGGVNEQIRVSRSVVERVASRQEAILIDNAETEFPDDSSVAELHIQSLMCAPLIDSEGNVFGFFQIDSESLSGFVRRDLVLMAAVAIQASLAINFARLHEQGLKQKVIEKDLELARDVQNEFLPDRSPNIPGYEFADFYKPARFIGGDYFDYVPLSSGRIAIVLADVGGKGAPAALYMARIAMETHACLALSEDASTVIAELNRRLSTRFATFVMCVLDPASHILTVVNAGHRPPLRRRRDGSIEPVGESVSGFPFSVLDQAEFEQVSFQLLPGEAVVIVSDGFEDAYNEATDEYFGIKRVEAAIQQADGSASGTVTDLVRRVEEFSAGATQLDDMCMVTWTRAANVG
jgi:serine phosphatase RsbU (regulator of sigma subunit)/pSer/pThr/pTyr-binding forkhead associated (FHA) protein